MHADSPRQCDNELQPDPQLALTPEPPLVHVLKGLHRVELQTAITQLNKLVMQKGDVEDVNHWELCIGYFLAREITSRRQRADARARKKKPKLTEETHQDALRRAPEEARRRGVKNSKKLLAQLLSVSSTYLRKWETKREKCATSGQ